MKYSLMLFSKFLNSLFLLQRANKQLSVLLGYDIAIQALNHHRTLIDCINHAGLVFKQSSTITLQINQYQERNNPTSYT